MTKRDIALIRDWNDTYREPKLFNWFLEKVWKPFRKQILTFGLLYNLMGMYFMFTQKDIAGGYYFMAFWAPCGIPIISLGLDKMLTYNSIKAILFKMELRGYKYLDLSELLTHARLLNLFEK